MKNFLSIPLVILCLAAMQVPVYAQKESTPEFEIVHFADIHLRTQFNSFDRFVQTVCSFLILVDYMYVLSLSKVDSVDVYY